MILQPITFKKGLYSLNPQPNFNFQLNRIIMWDGGRLEDIERIGQKINSSETWKKELLSIARQAENDGRIENAIAYYRMSEFFMYDGDLDKISVYQKSTELFYNYYNEYFTNGIVEKYNIPYEKIYLPVMYIKASGNRKDTILLHGGNDSYYEEFFFPALYLSQQGFDVYIFEGPGQGGVLRLQGKFFTHKWELPVEAILDYFKLDDITIIGASLGGYFAPRAAAFDNRIKRVVAWSVFPDFLEILLGTQPKRIRSIVKLLLKMKAKKLLNLILNIKIKQGDELTRWGIYHGMYAYDAATPYDYFVKIDQYRIPNVSDKVTQDMLIIGASQDHFADYRLIGDEINSLINVRSLTFRLMTEKECASNHCNCGNSKLVLDTIVNWINITINKESE